MLAKYGVDAYKIDLPSELGISPSFNVQDLVEFKGKLPQSCHGFNTNLEPTVVPSSSKLEVEQVLDSRVKKVTKHQGYMEHLIKLKGKPNSEPTWVPKVYFNKVGIPQDLLSIGVTQFSFVGEYGVGAPRWAHGGPRPPRIFWLVVVLATPLDE